MFDMYQGFASYKSWDFEVFNYTNAEYGKPRFCLNSSSEDLETLGYLNVLSGKNCKEKKVKIVRNTRSQL